MHLEESRYRYCTSYLIESESLDTAALERALGDFGDCVLVVGEAPLVKVHVHTDEPGRVLSLGVTAGSVDGIEIANMHEQARARERRLTVVEGGAERRRAADGHHRRDRAGLDRRSARPAAAAPAVAVRCRSR